MYSFTEENIVRSIIMFSIPLFLSNILQELYGIFDSIIVGQLLGTEGLASIGATYPVIRVTITFAIGITLGVSVTISQYIGSRNDRKIKHVISTALIFFLLIGILITCLGLIFSKPILEMVNTPKSIFISADNYLEITFLGTIVVLGYNLINAIFRGMGNSRTPLLILIISIVLNILLDVIFLGYFKLGVAGAAWATIISQTIAFNISLFFLFRKYTNYIQGFNPFKPKLFLVKHFLLIGLPSGLKGVFYWGGFLVLTSLINTYGAETTAAFASASRIDSFLQAPIGSLGQGVSVLVAQNIGAHKPERIKKGVSTSILMGIIFSITIAIAIQLFGEQIMTLFIHEQSVIRIGATYLRLVSLFYVIYSLQEVVQGVAIGCGKTWILMISTITAMWIVRIPLAYLLSSKLGIQGIWLSIPSGWIVAMLFTNGFYFSGKWKSTAPIITRS